MERSMRRLIACLSVLTLLAGLALAPHAAEARAGYGSSFGSRGSNTWSAPPATRTAPYAAPMTRSTTPYGQNYSGSGYRSGFGGGLLGGLIGFGLGSMLMGGGFGMMGLFGLIIRIVLIVMLVRFVMRLFRGPSMVASGPGGGGFVGPMGGAAGGFGARAAPQPGPPIAITQVDYQAFEQILIAVQTAWSNHDLATLRALTTPEMLGYFSEQLAGQASRGVRNVVADVRLLQGDLAQAWAEPGRDYATVAMRFSMTDVTYDAAGRIVDGNPGEHVTATEIWTFLRASAGGGRWILSAIQQAS
ncbi:MAG: TIM44-like domain-containing protein [Rhodospirillales bacterium]|nr:TIM44-like domain-containing protein [Rhodospirillales bacterium]